jgi:hypothetical protein
LEDVRVGASQDFLQARGERIHVPGDARVVIARHDLDLQARQQVPHPRSASTLSPAFWSWRAISKDVARDG